MDELPLGDLGVDQDSVENGFLLWGGEISTVSLEEFGEAFIELSSVDGSVIVGVTIV